MNLPSEKYKRNILEISKSLRAEILKQESGNSRHEENRRNCDK